MARRVVPIDLDARMENPEDRHGFRHPRLIEHVRQRRGECFIAALTVLKGFIQVATQVLEVNRQEFNDVAIVFNYQYVHDSVCIVKMTKLGRVCFILMTEQSFDVMSFYLIKAA